MKTSDKYITIQVTKKSEVKTKLKVYAASEGLTITQALEKLLNNAN